MHHSSNTSDQFQLQLRQKALGKQIERLPVDQDSLSQAMAYAQSVNTIAAYQAATAYLNTLEEIVALAYFGKKDRMMQDYICRVISALWSDHEAADRIKAQTFQLKTALIDNKCQLKAIRAQLIALEKPIPRPIKNALSVFWRKSPPSQKARAIRELLCEVPVDARPDLDRLNCCYAADISDILGNRVLPKTTADTGHAEHTTELRSLSVTK